MKKAYFQSKINNNAISLVFVCLFASCGSPSLESKGVQNTNLYNLQENDSELAMKKILSDLSKAAVELSDYQFEKDSSGWIGYNPATDEEIKTVESRLEVNFPSDFKAFMKISNGFPATNSVEPSFLSLSKIDYTKNIAPSLLKIWTDKSVVPIELANKYERSITIGGMNEEQMFMLIPPENKNEDWEYWKFALWIPGEEPYASLNEYFLSVIEFCKGETEKE